MDASLSPPSSVPEEASMKNTKSSARRRHLSFAALIAVLILVGTSGHIIALPLNRIIELRYCQEYYAKADPSVIGDGGSIPEHLCKVDEVQKRLGWLQGAYQTVAAAIDIAVTLPMGYLADRIGARTALGLNTVATTVVLVWIAAVGYFREVFPISAVLAGPILAAWGGGECVLRSTTMSLLAEIATDDAQRTTYLAYVTSVNYITLFFSPALAGALMEKNPWLPLWLGVASTVASIPFLVLLPHVKMHSQASTLNMAVQNTEALETEPLLEETDGPDKNVAAIAYPISNPIMDRYVNLIASTRTFRLLLTILFMTGFASSTSPLLIRYISKRYGWAYSSIGYLYTFKAAVNVFLLAIGVPLFTRLMLRHSKSSAAWADLVGTRATLIASSLGALLIGASVGIPMLVPSICVYAVGSALPVFMFSLARSDAVGTITSENESSAFSLMVLINSIGGVAGTPFITFLWVKGIEMGNAGLGLPYFASAISYAIAGFVAGHIHLP